MRPIIVVNGEQAKWARH